MSVETPQEFGEELRRERELREVTREQLVEALAHAALHDVFQFDRPKCAAALFRDNQRRSTRTGNLVYHRLQL